MKPSDSRSQEWRFEIEVHKAAAEPIRIRLREDGRKELQFDSWEALYRYLSERFPEWLGYLR